MASSVSSSSAFRSLNSFSSDRSSSQIIEINSLEDIIKYLNEMGIDPKTTLIASNILNTLITYEDPVLCSGVNKFIDDLVKEQVNVEIRLKEIDKADESKYLKLYKEKFMSIILLDAKYQLTENKEGISSASFINELAKKFFVIGFSESKTGPFGKIEKAENFSLELLKRFGISFAPKLDVEKVKKFSDDRVKQNYAIYNDGVLFVGNKEIKARIFKEFIDQTKLPINQVVVIDNRKENIERLQKELNEVGISVLGFVYKYKNETPIDPVVAAVQKTYLFIKEKWFSKKELEEDFKLFSEKFLNL